MKLSKNFSLHGLIKSATAARLGIDNTPTSDEVEKLKMLAQNCLQPIRDLAGEPVFVTSGFRCLELNREFRSKDYSQHRKAEAADIECFAMTTLEFYEMIKNSGIEYDQLILEYYKEGDPNSGWVHISWKPSGNRMEAFKWKSS